MAAVMDVPILEALERCTEKFARLVGTGSSSASPKNPSGRMADPLAWHGAHPKLMGAENHADFLAAIQDPSTVHGMLEDFRAGPAVDRFHDEADQAQGRT
ncbi:hypothetical protein ASE66_27990 [Bosea sp. Root483D1]|uniref:hypothetical protein n=1 Tax=Bosea sp. Root483D1 TaxID=1736544 RepID=UPI00070B4722|nr:hypothetical protein [Bosea sp. Root483D1]KRE21694.1 hypothetical protein ASE66_27990 [Bosea sp. Root483D1]